MVFLEDLAYNPLQREFMYASAKLALAISPLLTGYFGADQREPAYDQPQFAAVQRINLSSGWCTAFLVGPETAITAGHCTQENPAAFSLDQRGSFTAGWAIDGVMTAPGYALMPDAAGDLYPRNDWGLVHLAAPANLPNLELATADEVYVDQPAMTLGYPGPIYGGSVRVKDAHCSVRGFEADSILSDCATATGNSGGPLLVLTKSGAWKVAGVCSTELLKKDGTTAHGEAYSAAGANRFANLTPFVNEIRADLKSR